jgi:NADPH2:quinone reductase
MYLDLAIRFVIVYAMPEVAKQQAISDIEKRLRDEQLEHRVAYALPLADIARAHEIIEQGDCRGCVIVNINTA